MGVDEVVERKENPETEKIIVNRPDKPRYYNQPQYKLTKEERKKAEVRSKNTVKKVRLWQAYPYSRPLVCRRDDCDALLEPKIHPRSYQVYLKCPICKFKQRNIPRHVLKSTINIYDHALIYRGLGIDKLK